MVIRGILELAFGNILCLRGFAKLGELASVSKSDENYQRPIEDTHINNIVDFFNSGKYTFFPEVILGVSLTKLGLLTENVDSFYGVVDSGNAYKFSKRDGISISTYVKRYQNDAFPRHITASIYNLEKMIEEKPFSRIDGNHRLEAVENENTKNR